MKRWPGGFPRVATAKCPHCGKRLNAAGTLGNDAMPMPSPGDLSICFGCGEALQFDNKLHLRTITAAALAALTPEEAADLKRTQDTIRGFLAYGMKP